MRWFVGSMIALAVAAAAIAGSRSREPEVKAVGMPTQDARIAVYREWVELLAGRSEELSDQLNALAGSPRVQDERWLAAYRSMLNEMRGITSEAGRLDPPPCLAAAHAQFQAAVAQFDQAVGLIQVGFLGSEVEKTNTGYRLLAESAELIKDAEARVRKVRCEQAPR